jgi:ABC-2 type transport system permease protein
VRTALALQAATFSRSLTARLTTVLIVLFPPLFGVGMVALARSDVATGPAGAKYAPYREGPFDEAVASLAGQVVTVCSLICVGFAVAWLVGREWADGTIGSLFAQPVPRASIARAKLVVVGTWAAACVTAAAVLTAAATAFASPDGLTAGGLALLAKVWIAGLFSAALALPFAWVAVRTHGYLGAAGAVIGATALSQILASVGVGAWVPYVAPALWSGAGGADAAAHIGAPHLLLAALFAAVGVAASIRAFSRARLD